MVEEIRLGAGGWDGVVFDNTQQPFYDVYGDDEKNDNDHEQSVTIRRHFGWLIKPRRRRSLINLPPAKVIEMGNCRRVGFFSVHSQGGSGGLTTVPWN